MFWIVLFLICFFAGSIGGAVVVNSLKQKDEDEEDVWDIWILPENK